MLNIITRESSPQQYNETQASTPDKVAKQVRNFHGSVASFVNGVQNSITNVSNSVSSADSSLRGRGANNKDYSNQI
ncbi:MAG: hypothetical protein SFT68_02170 [Rickettsiaceae bacterium]|nr:hypothetical protein [Rickettsiaceae bacterium]